MTVPALALVELAAGPRSAPHLPPVVLGPSLGTSVRALWGAVARELGRDRRVLGWDLPGHGASAATDEPFTMAELARGVLEALDRTEDLSGRPFHYAGNSVGGCVGQQLLLDAPDRVLAAVLLGTAARVGQPQAWAERARLVAAAGTPTQVTGSAQRWFAPGFLEREPATATALLHDLQGADRFSYARVCEALERFDARDRLGAVRAPVLAVAGAHDAATPPADATALAEGTGGRAVILQDAAHLIPAESPAEVARLLAGHFAADPHPEGARA